MYVWVYLHICFCIHPQSETSVLSIPSLEFECEHSSLGGRFTTVEGMLVNVKAELEKSNPFLGDSSTHSKLKDFLEKLSEVCMYIHMSVYKIETRL